jgi:cell wall-associated NlpC family hydrolase
MGLIDTGYRFGGKNPEAGLDCSGMVSYIYGQAAGLKVRAAPPTSPATAVRSAATSCAPAIWCSSIP